MAGSAARDLAWQPNLPSISAEESSPASWSGDLLALLVPEEAFETTSDGKAPISQNSLIFKTPPTHLPLHPCVREAPLPALPLCRQRDGKTPTIAIAA